MKNQKNTIGNTAAVSRSRRRFVRRVCRFRVCPKCGTEHWEALRNDFAVCLVCDWEYRGPIYHPECTEEKHAAMKNDGWGKCLHCECDLIQPNAASDLSPAHKDATSTQEQHTDKK